ncbi:MAG: thioredoxin [Chlamydiae bacterium]|nr:thioredoxin [Chlamydiota bacterium]
MEQKIRSQSMSHKENISLANDENFAGKVSHGVTLVDFYADWCGPCRMLTPVIHEVADQLHDKAKFIKVDVDASQKIAAQFQVMSIPTLVLIKDGHEVGRLVGLRDAKTIRHFVESHCNS